MPPTEWPKIAIDDSGMCWQVVSVDRSFWGKKMQTYFGDANLDGEFDSTDLVDVFVTGEYEDAIPGTSTSADGDRNGDGDFNASDLGLALRIAGFKQDPRLAVVPEPATSTPVLLL